MKETNQAREYSHKKDNSWKNTIRTFAGAFVGAALMPAIKYLFYETTFDLLRDSIQTVAIAIFVTAVVLLFRHLYKTK